MHILNISCVYLQLFLGLVLLDYESNAEVIKRSEYLDNSNRYLVEWEVDLDTKVAVFIVSASKVTGYVGFGIANGPSMAGADIVIGGVTSDGTPYFQDYHAIVNANPIVDAIQNWNLLEAIEDSNGTTLKFSRVLDTCDDEDVAITDDTQYLIWAFGMADTITYHTNNPNRRGAKIMNLLDPPLPPVDVSMFDKWTIEKTTDIPASDTTYWCSVHRAPDFNGTKRHAVGFNTKLESELSKTHTHHLAVHKCYPPAGSTAEQFFQEYVGQPGNDCNSEANAVLFQNCVSYLYLWAIGGPLTLLPEVAGYPMGVDEGGVEYVLLEVHFDNPRELPNLQVKVEVEIYHTTELRDHDASVFIIGQNVSFMQTIPPQTPSFVTVGHCDPTCTGKSIPEDEVKIFNAMLHSHEAGRKMKVRHFRDKEELPWIAVDNHYNFDYQANRPLKNEISFLPGDQLTIECTYDTSARAGITVGGLPSSDEMCQAFLWHYPSQDFVRCESNMNPELLMDLFGIEEYEWSGSALETPTILQPAELAGKSYVEVLNAFNWTQELKDSLQDLVRNSDHFGICISASQIEQTSEHVNYPADFDEYIPTDECPAEVTSTSEQDTSSNPTTEQDTSSNPTTEQNSSSSPTTDQNTSSNPTTEENISNPSTEPSSSETPNNRSSRFYTAPFPVLAIIFCILRFGLS